jgi:CCR4-NOT transcriptional regulation complex NOT5 subunit
MTEKFPFKFEKLDVKNFSKFDTMKMFKQSFKSRPKMAEFEPTPLTKKPKNTQNFSILPQYGMILPETFKKMELDTLFFVSNFDQNEWHKLYAAKELGRRGWVNKSQNQDSPAVWV